MTENIPLDDVQKLWQNTPDKSWEGLKETAEERQGKAENVEDSLVNQILHLAQDMENSGEPFPSNPDELHRVLNNES